MQRRDRPIVRSGASAEQCGSTYPARMGDVIAIDPSPGLHAIH